MKADKHWQTLATHPVVWLLVGMVIALLLYAAPLTARARLNAGYLRLNRALVSAEPAALERAVTTLAAVEVDPAVGQRARRGIGLARLTQSRPDEAAAVWSTVSGMEAEIPVWAERAERGEDFAVAIAWHEIAVRLEPENGDHWYKLARASAAIGDDDARAYYLRALDSPMRTEFGRSNILTRLGELEKQASTPNWDAVLTRFDDAITRDDFSDERDIAQAHLGRAEALERLGRLEAALDEYRWLIRYEPGLYWANVHGGRLTWYLERDATTAAAYLEQAIDINPRLKWAYLNLGLVYAQSGRAEAAVPLFQQALAIDPDDQESRMQLDAILSGNDS